MAMYLPEPANIFVPRNDWNIRVIRARRYVEHYGSLLSRTAKIIHEEHGINPFAAVQYRGQDFVLARQMLMVIMSKYSNKTTSKIASELGKDHATLFHARKAIQNRYDTDRDFRLMYDRILNRVKSFMLRDVYITRD